MDVSNELTPHVSGLLLPLRGEATYLKPQLTDHTGILTTPFAPCEPPLHVGQLGQTTALALRGLLLPMRGVTA